MRRQGPAGEGDHHRVVAGEQQIDPDDLQHGERTSKKAFHQLSVSTRGKHKMPQRAVRRGGTWQYRMRRGAFEWPHLFFPPLSRLTRQDITAPAERIPASHGTI